MLLFANENEKSSPVATDLSGGFIISMLWLSTQLSLSFEGSVEFDVWGDEFIIICCHLPRRSSGIF